MKLLFLFFVLGVVACPPTWDPAIRFKHRQMGGEPMGWQLGFFDYVWTCFMSFVVLVLGLIFW